MCPILSVKSLRSRDPFFFWSKFSIKIMIKFLHRKKETSKCELVSGSHAFESRWSLNFFQAFLLQLLKLQLIYKDRSFTRPYFPLNLWWYLYHEAATNAKYGVYLIPLDRMQVHYMLQGISSLIKTITKL